MSDHRQSPQEVKRPADDNEHAIVALEARTFIKRHPEFGVIALGLIFFSVFLIISKVEGTEKLPIFRLFFWFLLVCIGISIIFKVLYWIGGLFAADQSIKRCVRWVFIATLVFWVGVGNFVGAVWAVSALSDGAGPFAPIREIDAEGTVVYKQRNEILDNLYAGLMDIFSGGTVVTEDVQASDASRGSDDQKEVDENGTLVNADIEDSISSRSTEPTQNGSAGEANAENLSEHVDGMSYSECKQSAEATEELLGCLKYK